jgi:hypothetical protein
VIKKCSFLLSFLTTSAAYAINADFVKNINWAKHGQTAKNNLISTPYDNFNTLPATCFLFGGAVVAREGYKWYKGNNDQLASVNKIGASSLLMITGGVLAYSGKCDSWSNQLGSYIPSWAQTVYNNPLGVAIIGTAGYWFLIKPYIASRKEKHTQPQN